MLWQDADAQLVALGFVDGVLLQYARAAGTVAQTHDGAVDAEIGLALVLQLVVVGFRIQVLGRVGKGREGEDVINSFDTDFLALLGL